MCKREGATVVKLFEQRVRTEPHKICFYFEDTAWTVADVSNDNTNEALISGFRCILKGDLRSSETLRSVDW